jgi:hypothetical protein
MGIQIYPTVPVAREAAEPWPADEFTIRADEMFARRLDSEFATGVHDLLHNPETGLSSLSGEAALEAIAGVYPALEDLRQRTLDGALGPRQRTLVESSINTRLDWAAGTIGRLAERATVQVDDESVAERIAGLGQDAAISWHDPAHLRKLGRAAVEELRWQGDRRGWDAAETEARTRAGLSDLYAGAVETAVSQNVDGAAYLLAHAREVIDPARLETIDHRISRAREDGFLREVDIALGNLPLEPTAPPGIETFVARAAELTPGDAADPLRARLGDLVDHAQHRAERQWHRRHAEAGIAALDWLKQNPDASLLFLPEEVRAWLTPDQSDGLMTLEQHGRLITDGDLFERLDRQSVYEPWSFADVDLDRHRLSLDDADFERFAAAQKAIAEGANDPAFARWHLTRIQTDRAIEESNVDGDSPEAADVLANVRDRLDSFEAIEGRPPNGHDIDGIVARAIHDFIGGDAPADLEPDAAFDPRHIILAQNQGGSSGRSQPPSTVGPQRSIPGPGHNRPPPGLPTAIDKLQRWRQSTTQPPATTPPPDSAGPGGAARSIENWLTEREARPDRDQYIGDDGIDTAAGIRLDPRVGEPAAGRDYLPDNESHQKGLRGEYGLANDIARNFSDHTIVEYGRKAGERGPDVVSVSRGGEVHVWDSKWRSAETSITSGGRAHQPDGSLAGAREDARISIEGAMKSGRLSRETADKALENLKNRNLTIVTVGTGNARNGVVERIVGGERAVAHPQRGQ